MSYPPNNPYGQQGGGQEHDPYGQDQYGQEQYGQPASGQPYTGEAGMAYPASAPPPQYQPQYQQPVIVVQNRGTNTMAVMALVFGIVFCPLGIVFGHIARKQIRDTGEDGDGLALAGMIIGYIQTGLVVLVCLLEIVAFGIMGAASSSS